MGGRARFFIIAAVVVVLLGLGLFFLLSRGAGQPAAPTPEPTTTKIVVAIQTIPRGGQIITGVVELREWPIASVPPGAYTDLTGPFGQYARFEIPPGIPILPGLIAPSLLEATVGKGSNVALGIPSGKVAVSFPITRLQAVAFAINVGDHIDVLASYWVVDLDEEFQTRLANNYLVAAPDKDGNYVLHNLKPGGRDRAPIFGFPAMDVPAEEQHPRLVAQLTVQNLVVLGIGDWASQVVATSAPAEGQSSGEGSEAAAPPPSPASNKYDVITVLVDPQDALVLKFLRESGAKIDLVLRSAKDGDQTFATESVTLQYMFTRFAIAQPPKLPYGLELPATPVAK
jgi:Flp pilus assembly protein CpaB